MLDPVAKLAQDVFGHVIRALADEIDANAFGPDQAGDLFHLVHQRPWGILEQQMRLVEEEDEPGFVRIADFRQHLEQFGQHPQQEGRIEPGRGHELVCGKNVDAPCPAGVDRHEITQIQRRFAEQQRTALVFQHQQAALDGADGGRRDIAVAQSDGTGIFADEDQQRLQILQIQQRQAFLIRQAEGDVQHALLRFGQFHQARQQKRPHIGHCGADRMALLAEKIPEGDREGAVLQIMPDGGCALHKGLVALVGGRSGFGQSGKIAFYIGQKHRHSGGGEAFGKHLKRHGLARPGGPRDQPVAVAVAQQKGLGQRVAFATAADENRTILGHVSARSITF